MTAHLTFAERAVALALYRHGGGTLPGDRFASALDRDPLACRLARDVTPIFERLVREMSDLLTPATPETGDDR